jgi:hypothetical protein
VVHQREERHHREPYRRRPPPAVRLHYPLYD